MRSIMLGVVLGMFVTTGILEAQPISPKTRFNEAVQAATSGSYQRAVELCQAVLYDFPENERDRVHKLLGYSQMKLGHLPRAWSHLVRAREQGVSNDEVVVTWLKQVAQALGQTHVKVAFVVAPADARISFSDEDSSSEDRTIELASPATWWFTAGRHRILV